jgi:hypothetical protein
MEVRGKKINLSFILITKWLKYIIIIILIWLLKFKIIKTNYLSLS